MKMIIYAATIPGLVWVLWGFHNYFELSISSQVPYGFPLFFTYVFICISWFSFVLGKIFEEYYR